MSKGFTNEAMKKAYQAIDYSVMNRVILYGYFSIFRNSISVLYSNYIPNQKGKTKSILQMRCIKTIKKLRLTSGFLYSLWKKLPSKHQMITC
jgi:hypothetical protein